jgi:hypothetical protein
VIQGQRGYGSTSTTGEGGDVYIWGGIGGETNSNSNGWGRGGGSGGDVKLRGGEGLNDTGGYVRIEGGNVAHFNTSSSGNPGFVEISGGDVVIENAAGSSYGGDVRITGGRAYTATTQSGVVQVITGGYVNGGQSGDKIWEFGNDGTLSLPNAQGQARSQIYTTNGGYQTVFETFNTNDGQGTGQKLTLDYDDAAVKIQTQAGTEWKFGQFGDLTLPGLMTLPVTTSTPAITTATGTVAVCDGIGWDGGGDGFEHLMIYINGVWTKAV